MKKPKVYNRHHGEAPDGAIYVGRGTKWGNPYVIGRNGSREEVIKKFKLFILPDLDVRALKGKDLICFCAPAACHADLLLDKANKK